MARESILQRLDRMRGWRFALLGGLFGLQCGSLATFVPWLDLWGFDVTWVVGTVVFMMYGVMLGAALGVGHMTVTRLMFRRRLK
jgi:hypothetical protein